MNNFKKLLENLNQINVEIVERGSVIQVMSSSKFMKLCAGFFGRGSNLFLTDYIDLYNKEYKNRKARVVI